MIPVYVVVLSIGALIEQSLHTSVGAIVVLGCILFLAVLILFPSRRGAVFGVILSCVFFIGALRIHIGREIPDDFFGKRTLTARVQSVDRRLEKTMYVVKDLSSKKNVQMESRIPLEPGNIVTVSGIVEQPEDFMTDTGRIFPYQRYMESKGIVGVMKRADVSIISIGKNSLMRIATRSRHMIAALLTQAISFPIDGIVAGMLVGYQGGIPETITDLFRDTGVLHVFVLSGFNITLLAGILGLLLKPLPLKIKSICIGFSILFLVLMSGSGTASVRAGVMGSLVLLSRVTRIKINPFKILLFTFVIFLFLTPKTIFYDPGFHLSFLATFFMILVLPKIEGWFRFIPDTRVVSLRELVMLAASVPVFMLPYTMYFSGIAPLSGIPANMALAIVSPLFMSLGVLIIFFSWIPSIAILLGMTASFLGAKLITILEALSHLPKWNTPPLSWQGVLGVYTVILVILFRRELRLYARQLRRVLVLPASSSGLGSRSRTVSFQKGNSRRHMSAPTYRER